MATRAKKGNGERGPDRGPRKGSPLKGKAGPRTALPRQRRDRDALRRSKVLAMLLDGKKPKEIEADGVCSVATVYNYMNEPAFAAELHHHRDSAVQAARNRLALAADEQVDYALHLAKSGTKEDMARVQMVKENLRIIGIAPPTEVHHSVTGGLDLLSDAEIAKRMEAFINNVRPHAEEAGDTTEASEEPPAEPSP